MFYGSNKGVLDGLSHRLLVNCELPVREKDGFESMAMYINNVDYYQPDKSKVLSPEKIAIMAKCIDIEPKCVRHLLATKSSRLIVVMMTLF